jgi:hypothetical protein
MPKKNPTDPILLARSILEAAIGEPLTPKKPKKPKKRPPRRRKKK